MAIFIFIGVGELWNIYTFALTDEIRSIGWKSDTTWYVWVNFDFLMAFFPLIILVYTKDISNSPSHYTDFGVWFIWELNSIAYKFIVIKINIDIRNAIYKYMFIIQVDENKHGATIFTF